MSELIDQIKGAFDGDNSAEFKAGLTEMLQSKGLKILDKEGEQALFTGYTDKNFQRTREFFGKQGQELYKDEDGKELAFYKQYTTDIETKQAAIAQQAETIKSMQSKLDSIKGLEGADNEALNAAKQELKETQALYKAEQEKSEKFKTEFEGKAKEQRFNDILKSSAEGLKYKVDIPADVVDSAKAFAFNAVKGLAQEFRDDKLVFLDANNDALRDDKGGYITASDMVKKHMAHVLDTQKQVAGLGSEKKEGKDSGAVTYVPSANFTSKIDLLNDMKSWCSTRGVQWHTQQPLYRQLVQDNNLK